MKNIIEREVDGILTDILDDYKKERAIDKNDIYNQPDKNEIIAILDHLMAIVYPGFFREKSHKIYNLSHTVSFLPNSLVNNLRALEGLDSIVLTQFFNAVLVSEPDNPSTSSPQYF